MSNAALDQVKIHSHKNRIKHARLSFCRPQRGQCRQPSARDGGDDLVGHLPRALRLGNPQHRRPLKTLLCHLWIALLPRLLFQLTKLLLLIIILPPNHIILVHIPFHDPTVTNLVFPTLPEHKERNEKPKKILVKMKENKQGMKESQKENELVSSSVITNI